MGRYGIGMSGFFVLLFLMEMELIYGLLKLQAKMTQLSPT